MKPLVLFIVFLEIIFSLAEDKKCFCLCAGPKGDTITKPIGNDENQIERRQWSTRPQIDGPLCQDESPASPRLKLDGDRVIFPGPTNAAWRTNQVVSKDQNPRWYPNPWTPPPQQRYQECLNPPHPSRIGMNPMLLPAQSPINPAWRTSPDNKNLMKSWYPLTPPPQPQFQGCPIPPKPWSRIGTNQMSLPASSPGSFGWRPNQGMYNWMNPFYLGLQNYYPHWGYPSQFQNSMFPRYIPRPPAPNIGMPLSLPMQPAMNRPWGVQPNLAPPRRWHMQIFGPPNGGYPMHPWHVMPHIGSGFPPFYLADRNQFYKK